MPKKDEYGDVDKLVEGIQAMREGRAEDAAKAWGEARDIQEKVEKQQEKGKR